MKKFNLKNKPSSLYRVARRQQRTAYHKAYFIPDDLDKPLLTSAEEVSPAIWAEFVIDNAITRNDDLYIRPSWDHVRGFVRESIVVPTHKGRTVINRTSLMPQPIPEFIPVIEMDEEIEEIEEK